MFHRAETRPTVLSEIHAEAWRDVVSARDEMRRMASGRLRGWSEADREEVFQDALIEAARRLTRGRDRILAARNPDHYRKVILRNAVRTAIRKRSRELAVDLAPLDDQVLAAPPGPRDREVELEQVHRDPRLARLFGRPVDWVLAHACAAPAAVTRRMIEAAVKVSGPRRRGTEERWEGLTRGVEETAQLLERAAALRGRARVTMVLFALRGPAAELELSRWSMSARSAAQDWAANRRRKMRLEADGSRPGAPNGRRPPSKARVRNADAAASRGQA